MKFEPTYDYSQTDLNKEKNLILWKFGELIKCLITIASNADEQKSIIGMGIVTDEIAMDFDSYFRLSGQEYLDRGLLNKEAFEKLLLIDNIFERKSGDNNPDFWDDDLLDTNEDWIDVRLIARNVLKLLGMDNLDIECVHRDIIDKDEVIGQHTRTQLVKKRE